MIKEIAAKLFKKAGSLCSRLLFGQDKKYVLAKNAMLGALTVTASAVLVFNVVSDAGREAVRVLYCDGEKIGAISSLDDYENAKLAAEKHLLNIHGVAYRIPDESISYSVSTKAGGEFLSLEEIATHLVLSAEKQFSVGYGLYIDDTLVAVGESREQMQEILDETVELYNELYAKVKTSDDIVVFRSKTNLEKMSVPKGIIKTKDEIRSIIGLDSLENLNEILLSDRSLSEEYTVQDISMMISEIDRITQKDISLALPAENVYYVGDPLGENNEAFAVGENESANASLSFGSTAVEVVSQVLPCDEEIVYDNTLPKGKKVLERAGVYGIKQITYDVSYLDGVEQTRTLVSEEVVKEPVSKILRVGTKSTGALEKFVYVSPGETPAGATGSFLLPTAGTLTSNFEGRNLFGVYEFHGAIDVANKVGTAIYASDGGVVTLARRFDSYGNCIIIDHGNGFETLYAHLDAYCVKEGDVVGQGWQIGKMGKTGRVTGSHLHFEVRLNGEKVDPLKFISD